MWKYCMSKLAYFFTVNIYYFASVDIDLLLYRDKKLNRKKLPVKVFVSKIYQSVIFRQIFH